MSAAKTPFGALLASAILVTMCLVSIGAIVFGPADVLNKWLFPPLALWTTVRCTHLLLRDAIATEAHRAETVQLGSVHEGAGPKDIAQ